MSIERIKKDCKYIDHPICQYAGSEGCADCILNMANARDAADIASGWEVTQSNLPDDIDALHTSTACQFCREGAREKVAYALIEMAHPEPEYMKKKFFGLGQETRAQVGSLLQIPVPICAHCKKLLYSRCGKSSVDKIIFVNYINYAKCFVYTVVFWPCSSCPSSPILSMRKAAGMFPCSPSQQAHLPVMRLA